MRSYDYTGQLFDRVISKGKTRYNPKGMTTLVEAWTFNQKWEISTAYRWDYTFDENGRLIESVLEAYQDDAYKLKFRDEYAYSND